MPETAQPLGAEGSRQPPAPASNPRRGPSPVASVADTVKLYLREIGQVPLLSAAEEVALAKRMSEGKAASERLEEATGGEAELSDSDIRLRLEGVAAKNILIESNLRLVVSIAKRYRNRGVAFLDLIQEGNLGLMRAVDRFDYQKGFKFSTYATWWIRQSISRSLADQSRTIRIPVHMVDVINQISMVQRNLLQDLGREPTVEEVAESTGLSVERVLQVINMSRETLSLEQPLGEEDFSLSDTIEDTAAVAPAEAAAQAMMAEAVEAVLAELPARERRVVSLRFGMVDGRMHTLDEVGKEVGVTRERIRQLEIKTLYRLRNPSASKRLRGYLSEE